MMLVPAKIFVGAICIGAASVSRFAFAQDAAPVPDAVKPFAPVYRKYVASYIGRKGEEGLRSVVTADFAWKTGEARTLLRGQKAIAKAAQQLGFTEAASKNPAYRVTRSISISCSVPQISGNGTNAVIHSRHDYGVLVFEPTTAKGSTAIGMFKETWKKTKQGWKLAAMEYASEPNAGSGNYTVVASGDESKPIQGK